MAPHEAAQEVAWFVILIFIGIGLVLLHDMKKDK